MYLSFSLLLLLLSVLHHTVGTFVEHYLADISEWKKKEIYVSSCPGKCNDDNGMGRRRRGGERRKPRREELLLLLMLLLLLFSSSIQLRLKISAWLIKIRTRFSLSLSVSLHMYTIDQLEHRGLTRMVLSIEKRNSIPIKQRREFYLNESYLRREKKIFSINLSIASI